MSLPALIEAAQDVLTQGLNLLYDLDQRSYARVANHPFDASLGQHYRHVLDHFFCLIKGLPAGEINYDERARSYRLESELTYASVATCDVLRVLKRIPEESLNKECQVTYSVGYGHSAPSSLGSNIGRELAFCVGHAVHHYAIIRLLCDSMGLAVPAEFGVAPSTLKHMAAMAAD